MDESCIFFGKKSRYIYIKWIVLGNFHEHDTRATSVSKGLYMARPPNRPLAYAPCTNAFRSAGAFGFMQRARKSIACVKFRINSTYSESDLSSLLAKHHGRFVPTTGSDDDEASDADGASATALPRSCARKVLRRAISTTVQRLVVKRHFNVASTLSVVPFNRAG